MIKLCPFPHVKWDAAHACYVFCHCCGHNSKTRTIEVIDPHGRTRTAILVGKEGQGKLVRTKP